MDFMFASFNSCADYVRRSGVRREQEGKEETRRKSLWVLFCFWGGESLDILRNFGYT